MSRLPCSFGRLGWRDTPTLDPVGDVTVPAGIRLDNHSLITGDLVLEATVNGRRDLGSGRARNLRCGRSEGRTINCQPARAYATWNGDIERPAWIWS